MAKAKIVLGGEIDVVTSNEMKTGLSDLAKLMDGPKKTPRIMRPLAVSYNLPVMASGDQFQVSFGSPNTGRVWILTRLAVFSGGNDHQGAPNLGVALYIGDSATPMLAQCVAPGQVPPFVTVTNEHSFVAHDREDIFLNMRAFGAVTATQIVATATVWEYRDSDIEPQAI